MKITIVNGPNLNMLGKREPEIYGSESFTDYLVTLENLYPGIVFDYFQSNIEGELVTAVQQAGSLSDGVIINPGAYTHTSVAVADAIASINKPVIEVHISNLLTREDFRHNSLTGRYCRGTVMGLGLDGYRLATEALLNILKR